MEKEQPALTKTCSICGNIKPLAAFLYMSGSSTEYGSVCADCRKKGADKPRIPESEGTTRSSSGAVIDSKSKQQADIDKQTQHELTQEEYYKEREEAGTEQEEKTTKKEEKAALEKQHRQTFLSHGLLGGKKPNTSSESRWHNPGQITPQKATEIAATQEQASKEEVERKEVAQNEGENFGFGLQEKHKGIAFQEGVAFKQGAAFQAFRTRLGKSQEKTPPSTLAEEIEKNWGPGRKK